MCAICTYYVHLIFTLPVNNMFMVPNILRFIFIKNMMYDICFKSNFWLPLPIYFFPDLIKYHNTNMKIVISKLYIFFLLLPASATLWHAQILWVVLFQP